jgi:hypothetical protein
MINSHYANLVGRLEREADRNPRRYAVKVAWAAALGFLPVALPLLIAVAALAWFLITLILPGKASASAFLLAALGGGVAFPIIRGLMVEVVPPPGREITREQAPQLFATLDDVLQRNALLKAGRARNPSIDSVALDGMFDATLISLPAWGAFGRCTHHVQLGVPLLAALNIAELKAVLAHEVGHVRSEDGAFAAWIYGQRTLFTALAHKLATPENLIERMLARYYARYVPWFRAYSFIYARKHEYAADRAAAKATHPGALAAALTKIGLMSRFLTEIFWPRLMSQVEKHAEPPYLPFSMMPRAFAVSQKEWARQDWLQRRLGEFAGEGDTHPGLGERFSALQIAPAVPSYSADRSALSLFGGDAPAVLKWCDEEWRLANVVDWKRRHAKIRELRWKIQQYENTPAANLKPEDHFSHARLLLDLGDESTAIDTLKLLVAREGSMASAHLLLGRLLLKHGDEQGLTNLALTARHDVNLMDEAGELGYGYLIERGRKKEAERFLDRIRAA